MRLEELSSVPVISAAPNTPASAVITGGQALSAAVDLADQRLHRIAIPTGFTAAAITFSASATGATYHDLYDTSGEVTIPAGVVAAGRTIVVDPSAFFGVRFLKIRSGTSAAPVVQGADATLTLVTVPR